VADRSSQEVIGGVAVGPAATELIAELTLAVTSRAKVGDLVEVIHAHPTLHEATLEAALGCLGRAIHLP
jgi:dihydrolipoamide dehydrogenase